MRWKTVLLEEEESVRQAGEAAEAKESFEDKAKLVDALEATSDKKMNRKRRTNTISF